MKNFFIVTKIATENLREKNRIENNFFNCKFNKKKKKFNLHDILCIFELNHQKSNIYVYSYKNTKIYKTISLTTDLKLTE